MKVPYSPASGAGTSVALLVGAKSSAVGGAEPGVGGLCVENVLAVLYVLAVLDAEGAVVSEVAAGAVAGGGITCPLGNGWIKRRFVPGEGYSASALPGDVDASASRS